MSTNRVRAMNKNTKKSQRKLSRTITGLSLSTALLSTLIMSSTATAGAWVGKEGSGYVKLGFANFTSDTYRGNNPTFKEFDGDNTSLYAEYGLGNSFSIYGSLLHQSYTQEDTVTGISEAEGFADTEIGIRYQWQANPFVLSTSFLVKTPFLYEEDDGLGNAQEDYEAKVLIGKGLDEYGYFGIEMGYRLRTGAPSDEYRYLIEYGFNITENAYFRTKLDGILSAENSDDSGLILNTNLSNPLEYDSGKLELTTGYNFNKNSGLKGFGVELTYTQEIYGNNILEGDSIQVGITKVF